jgi:MFS family permease
VNSAVPVARAHARPGSARRGIACVFAAVLAVGVTTGVGYPLFSLYLADHGASSASVALSGAMTALGMAASAPLLPRLVRTLGLWGLFSSALGLMIVVLAAIAVWRSEAAWFPLRFVLGGTLNCVFVCSEMWLNQASPERVRARILSAYTTTLSAGIMAGPVLLAALGTRTITPFATAAALAALAVIPLVAGRRAVPVLAREEIVDFSLRRFARHVGPLLGALVVLAFFSASVLSLLPVYLADRGVGHRTAALAVTAVTLGTLLLQGPIGWLADRTDRNRVLLVCTAAGVGGGVALPLLDPSGVVIWLVIVAWGGLAYGVYPVGLAVLGSSLTAGQMVSANAVWSFLWGMGGAVGLPVSGAAMSLLGPEALPLTLALVWTVAIAWLLTARPRGAASRPGGVVGRG